MEIHITDQQKKLPLRIKSIQTIVKAVLLQLDITDAQLSIVFVSSQKIRALNIKYLGRAHTTDVLAFDLSSEVASKKKLHGEIIISTDAVVQNSRQFDSAPATELVLYIVHGVLHLLGYDDHSPADTARMRAKEAKILEGLGRRPTSVIQKPVQK